MTLVLLLLSIPVALGCGYLFVLTLLSATPTPPTPGPGNLRFDLIVPSHNEEAGVGDTVRALLQLDYPRDRFRVVVVADNCTDETAARAAEAGANVLVRNDAEKRGKGYALEYAFAESKADAVVVIDADSRVTPNLLRAFETRLAHGAQAIQADYAVLDPQSAWRKLLMAIAFSAFHRLRSQARERLGVSCGLRGNGMCFAIGVLREVPHDAYSVVEDVEYGIRLGEAGKRVHHAGEAQVFGEMVAGEKVSRSQRRRWEGGRLQLAKLHGVRLVRKGLQQGNRMLLDLGLDVLVPPLALLTSAAALGFVASLALYLLHASSQLPLLIFSACLASVVLYVLRGWQLSGTGASGLLALCFAPVYVIWKLTLALRPKEKRGEWVRTSREENANRP